MVCGPEAAGEKMEEFIICDDCVNPDNCNHQNCCRVQDAISEDVADIRGESA